MKRSTLIACLFSISQVIDSQVGIGTAAPSEALDLENSTDSEVDLGINNTSAGDPTIHFQISDISMFSIGIDNSDGNKFKIGTLGVDTLTILTIDANGDIGINNEDPAYKLEVGSNINMSSGTGVYRIGSAHGISKPNTRNIYIGQGAGAQNNAGGTNNTFAGYQAGYSNTTADYNVNFGTSTAYTNQSGSQNVAFGYEAGYLGTSGSSNIKIGYQAGYGETGSNKLYLDNSSNTNSLFYVSNFTADDLVFNGGLTVNEQSGTFGFRAESDLNTHQLFVDAANDYVKISSENTILTRDFQIAGTTDISGLSLTCHEAGAQEAYISFGKARGIEGASTIVADNDLLGSIKFLAYDGTDYAIIGATIEAKVDGVTGVDDLPAELRFQTTPDGSDNQLIRMVVSSAGNVGVGVSSPSSVLDVEEDAATVATFNRTTDDGVLVDFQYAGSSEGSINVSGNTMTYNAFTGAHYATSRAVFEYGKVVVINGENDNFHHCLKSEILYGIEYSQKPNDKRVLGSYSGLLESTRPFSADNPHLVMAVGNGKFWVTNEGGEFKVGDYLITASTEGMVMKDNGIFPVSYICARSAEKINWRKVKADEFGVKKKLISVFYESFEVENVSNEIEALDKAIKEFKAALLKS